MAKNTEGAKGVVTKQSQQSPSFTLPNGSVSTTMLSSAVQLALIPSGATLPYSGTSVPTGFLACDGSTVSRTLFATLFAAIGTTFGVGDGSTTFAVPDLRGRTPIGDGTYTDPTSGSITRTIGQSVGEAAHVLLLAEMPSHNHGGGNHTHAAFAGSQNGSPAGALNGWNGGSASGSVPTGASGTIISTQGSDGSHNNMQPSLVTKFIIKY